MRTAPTGNTHAIITTLLKAPTARRCYLREYDRRNFSWEEALISTHGDAIIATRRQSERLRVGVEAERAAADPSPLATKGVATQPSRWELTARPGP